MRINLDGNAYFHKFNRLAYRLITIRNDSLIYKYNFVLGYTNKVNTIDTVFSKIFQSLMIILTL